MTGELLWYVARAGGFVAFGLLTLSVALGLLTSLRVATSAWPRWMTTELHRFVTLAALSFVGVHVLSIVVQPEWAFGLTQALVPFTAGQDRLWTAMGVVAMQLAVAIWVSTRLRARIGYTRWRQLHYAAFGAFGLALLHGLMQGTDSATSWGRLAFMAAAGLVGGLVAVRVVRSLGATVTARQPG